MTTHSGMIDCYIGYYIGWRKSAGAHHRDVCLKPQNLFECTEVIAANTHSVRGLVLRCVHTFSIEASQQSSEVSIIIPTLYY